MEQGDWHVDYHRRLDHHQPIMNRWYLSGAGVLLLLGTLIFAPMFNQWRDKGDYVPHAEYAQRLIEGDPAFFYEVPNFLYHASVAAVMLFPVSIETAGMVVSVGYHLLLGVIIYALLQQRPATPRSTLIAVVLALALLLVAPFNLLTGDNLYFGYFMPYVYHNPTGIPLRPLALLLFVAALKTFEPTFAARRLGLWVFAFAALTLLCILAKPSYLMILLPSLALVTLWRMVQRTYINWVLLIGGIVAPAVGLLGFQALTYSEGGMAWEPLRTFFEWTLHYEPAADENLALKLVFSALFPLSVYALYWRTASRDLMLNLAWLGFIAGLLYAYLFIDTTEIAAGNLVWNAQIGVLVLFVASAVFALKQPVTILLPLSMSILLLHLISGLHWYIIHLNTPYGDLIYVYW